MLLVGLLPLLLTTMLLCRHADGLIAGSRQNAEQTTTAAAAAGVGATITGDVQAVRALAAVAPLLAARALPDPLPASMLALYRTGPDGSVIAASRPRLVGHGPRGVPAAGLAMAARAPAAVLGNALGGTTPTITIAAPILRGSTVLGAMVAEFDPSALYQAMRGSTLLAADGRLITGAALPPGPPITLLGAPGAAPEPLGPRAGQPIPLHSGAWADTVFPAGSSRLLLVSPLYAAPEQTLDAPWLRALLALLAAATVATALWLTRWLGRPLRSVAQTLALVRAGNFGARTDIRQQDEIGQIAANVDVLTTRTQALVAHLESQRADLENGIIQLFTELSEAASGDLTVRPTLSEGSLGAVADSVSVLLDRFKSTVKRIKTTAEAVSSSTSAMTTTVAQVSQEARQQAEQLASSAQAIAEVAESAESVSRRTRAATDVAGEAVAAVTSGTKAVSFARDAVRRTTETSRKAAREVKSLGESAQLMGSALLLVQHNTEELHMIAGNASIEAARYAESGGIFRTVADSIEQLAQQSQEALGQIQTVIENTQRETSRVVAAIEDVTGEVANLATVVNLAGENFDTIDHVVQRLADLNVFIAGASKQQAGMAAKVAGMIGALNQVSLQTSRHMASSAEDAAHLRELTEQLNDSVATLKVS
jgi:methyl-accepting chemotaxis protein